MQTPDLPRVAALMAALQEECYVARSGDGWVGVYSKRCEETGGVETPRLAERLSTELECRAIAFLDCNTDFFYWLFEAGKEIDRFPPRQARWSFPRRCPLEKLCPTERDADLLRNVLHQPCDDHSLRDLARAIGIQYGQLLFADFEDDVIPHEVATTARHIAGE